MCIINLASIQLPTTFQEILNGTFARQQNPSLHFQEQKIKGWLFHREAWQSKTGNTYTLQRSVKDGVIKVTTAYP